MVQNHHFVASKGIRECESWQVHESDLINWETASKQVTE